MYLFLAIMLGVNYIHEMGPHVYCGDAVVSFESSDQLWYQRKSFFLRVDLTSGSRPWPWSNRRLDASVNTSNMFVLLHNLRSLSHKAVVNFPLNALPPWTAADRRTQLSCWGTILWLSSGSTEAKASYCWFPESRMRHTVVNDCLLQPIDWPVKPVLQSFVFGCCVFFSFLFLV